MTIGDDTGETATVAVALRSHKLSWKKRISWSPAAGVPQTREHGAFLVVPEENAAYLYQGSGYRPQNAGIQDSWRLDLVTGGWTPWTPAGDVSGAGSRRVVAVPGTSLYYAFGGYDGNESNGELLRLDLGRDAQTVTSLGSREPRQLHAMAFDAAAGQIVVFGGWSQDERRQEALDDTWLVKPDGAAATWTELETNAKPSARYGAFSAFDTASRRLVVWSGGQYPEYAEDPVNAAQDAWALDLAAEPPSWTKLSPAIAEGSEAPRGRRNGCAMHDPVGRRLFVYGGTSDGKTTEPGLFVLDLEPGREAWTKLTLENAPPIRSSGFGFATPEGDVTCAFGNDDAIYADVNFLGYE